VLQIWLEGNPYVDFAQTTAVQQQVTCAKIKNWFWAETEGPGENVLHLSWAVDFPDGTCNTMPENAIPPPSLPGTYEDLMSKKSKAFE